ncbi:MFS transporter [Cellulosimicrobium protaetiae]|uniref:MFS transporter n=1 Tax=Cellulosimicrobium protaetiae TaxID=2587808 RepID=A0A6M5UCD2_9MICO|nr:MFS transporter [Cellulosimicrobium protaetiae]QJW34855.1 MFS transporter [Cellulosimicrobium protaetiae]
MTADPRTDVGSPTSDTSADPAGTLSPGTQRTVLFGMVAFVFLGAFEALAVATAMPTVAVELDGLTLYTLAFAASLASSVVGMVASGRWSDRAGPTTPLWTGIGLFLAGLLVAGLAQDMLVLVAGRVLQGVGTGLYIVALYVLVARVFPVDRRPKVFAAFAAAWVIPSIVGPAIAGLVVEHVGWRWVFLAVPVLAVPALILMRPGMRAARGSGPDDAATAAPDDLSSPIEDAPPYGTVDAESPLDRTARQASLTWAVVAAVGIGALNYAGQLRGLGLVALLVASLAAVALAVPRLLPPGTTRAARGLPSVIAIRGLVAAAFTGAEVLLPLLLSHERGLAPSLAGAVLTFGAVGWSTGSWLRGRATWGLAHAGYVRLGGALVALGVAGAALLAWTAVPPVVGMVAWTLAGLGMGMTHPTLSVLTLELSPVAEQGANSSALQVSDAVAAATALAVTGSLLWALHPTLGLASYVVCFGVTVLLAAGVALLAPRTRPTLTR